MLNGSLNSTLDRIMTFDRALDQAFSGSWGGNGASRLWVPPLDVLEKHDAYVIHCELAGIEQDDIELGFEQNVLTIHGTKPSSLDRSSNAEVRVYAAERVSGAFERQIRLPEFVDGDRIAATFSNGLLTVVIPKAKAAQPRKIAIASPEPEAHAG